MVETIDYVASSGHLLVTIDSESPPYCGLTEKPFVKDFMLVKIDDIVFSAVTIQLAFKIHAYYNLYLVDLQSLMYETKLLADFYKLIFENRDITLIGLFYQSL